ncbi:MAG: proton-conducting transporter membrane subunit, partial [Candidatus Competibacterales bacterium]
MIEHFNPAWAFFLAALGIPLARGRWLPGLVIAAPLLGLIQLLTLPLGEHAPLLLFGLELKTLRLDGLSFPFALIFHLIALLTALYALHLRDRLQQVAMLTYMGATIGAVLAGDLITLFVYWELTALTSVFLLWAPGTPRAVRVGMRYLAVQVVSGVLLIGGAVLFYNDTSDIAFGTIGLDAPGGW